MTEPAKPGILDRLRTRFRWFDHVMRAQERYQDSKGDFYAAGITYFTIFALFPLLMVAFAIAGFVLASQPDLLAEITDKIKSTVSGDLGDQLVELMDSAIESRTSVGIIGSGHGRVGRAGLDGQPAGGTEPDVGTAAPRAPGLPANKALRSARHRGPVRRDHRHGRVDRARQLGPDETCRRMAWAAGSSGYEYCSCESRPSWFPFWSHGCCSPGSSRGCRGRRSAFGALRGPD